MRVVLGGWVVVLLGLLVTLQQANAVRSKGAAAICWVLLLPGIHECLCVAVWRKSGGSDGAANLQPVPTVREEPQPASAAVLVDVGAGYSGIHRTCLRSQTATASNKSCNLSCLFHSGCERQRAHPSLCDKEEPCWRRS